MHRGGGDRPGHPGRHHGAPGLQRVGRPGFLARQHARLTHGEGISQAVIDAATGRSVGLIYLDRRPQSWIAGLGYWLVPAVRGRHLATPAIRLVTEWALRELEVLRVEAWVAPDNLPSQRVLEHAGFQLEGRLRNFLQLHGRTGDGLVYSRTAPGPSGLESTG